MDWLQHKAIFPPPVYFVRLSTAQLEKLAVRTFTLFTPTDFSKKRKKKTLENLMFTRVFSVVTVGLEPTTPSM